MATTELGAKCKTAEHTKTSSIISEFMQQEDAQTSQAPLSVYIDEYR